MPTSILCDSALDGYVRRWDIIPDMSTDDILSFFDEAKPEATRIFNLELDRLRSIKHWTLARATVALVADEDFTVPVTFRTNATVLLRSSEVAAALQTTKVNLQQEIERYEAKASDWIVSQVDSLEIHAAEYQPLRASSFKKLPPYIAHKRAIVNPQNEDQKCFAWAILTALHPSPNCPYRVRQYEKYMNPFYSELNFEGIEFPVAVDDIPKFEQQNDVSVNVFTFEPVDESIYPIYRTRKRLQRHVNLFVYDDHYSYIRNIHRFFFDQNGHRAKQFYCDMCLYPFVGQDRLLQHQQYCGGQDPSRICIPKPGHRNIVRFAHVRRTIRRPLVAYVDLARVEWAESHVPEGAIAPGDHQQQNLELCCYGMVLARSCCGKSTFEDMTVETGKQTIEALMEALIYVAEHKLPQHKVKPLAMTSNDNERFAMENDCSLCMKPLGKDKVRDHCHICGRYRQALHAVCNQQLCHRKRLPVVIRNRQRYGSNTILRSIGNYCVEKDLKISRSAEETHALKHDIYVTSHEDYLKFTVHGPGSDSWRIEFIDAVRFLHAPLEKLLEMLPLENARSLSQFLGDEILCLLKRRGMLPSGTIESWEMLLSSGLLTHDEFRNKFADAEKDYEFYLNISEQLGIRKLQDYVATCIKTRVLLLADAFESFRDTLMDVFSIDPSTYNTLLGLGWDACLKLTGVELELITDPGVYNFVEAGMRCGIVLSSRRSSKANNPYVEAYNPQQANRYIMCLHSNNLQAGAMRSPLPTGKFRFLDQDERESFDISAVRPHCAKGYILECDLDYSDNLRDSHSCYPLAPEKMEITTDMLSVDSAEISEAINAKDMVKTKLMPNVNSKNKCILHHKNLQLYIELGMKLIRTHRVLEFDQRPWLEPFATCCLKKQQEATNELTRGHYRLLINAVFEKSMEIGKNYISSATDRFISQRKKFLKITKKTLFDHARILADNLVFCVVKKPEIYLDKPLYTGFCLQENAKAAMYRFHYSYIKEKYGGRAQLLMADSDRLVYEIEAQDIYSDMAGDIEMFDTSNYPWDHFLYNTKNKHAPFKMRDELAGEAASEFVALHPRVHSIQCGRVEKKKPKTVRKLLDKHSTVAIDLCQMGKGHVTL